MAYMKWLTLHLTFAALCATTAAFADSPTPKYPGRSYDCDPLPEEMLTSPIDLNGCDGVQVIEWRPSKSETWTAQSPKAVRVLTAACKLATRRFHEFVALNKLRIETRPRNEFVQFVSLMPFYGAEGRQPRNLNDLSFRFNVRPEPNVDGWTGHKNKTIFIRNDVLTPTGRINHRFVLVFMHELYHAQSYYYGVYNNLPNPQVDDEYYARKFTEFLGYKDE